MVYIKYRPNSIISHGFIYINSFSINILYNFRKKERPMEDKNQNIRNRLNSYIKTKGIKAKWVCEQCGGIDPSLLCRFRKGKPLWDETLIVIESFLIKNDL